MKGFSQCWIGNGQEKREKPRRRCQTLAYIRGSKIECFQHEKKTRAAKSVLNRYRKGYLAQGQNGDEQAALGITFSHSQ